MRAGRWEEALPHIEAALQISPRDPRRTMFESTLAIGHLATRRPAEAARWAREALRESRIPDYLRLRATCVLLSALGHLGETDFSDASVRRFMTDPFGTLRQGQDFLWYFSDVDSAEARYYLDGIRKAGVQEDILSAQLGALPPRR
jgi:hypothetical protein